MSSQTCMLFFLLWNTEENILKNVGEESVLWPLMFIVWALYVSQKKESQASLEWHNGE